MSYSPGGLGVSLAVGKLEETFALNPIKWKYILQLIL